MSQKMPSPPTDTFPPRDGSAFTSTATANANATATANAAASDAAAAAAAGDGTGGSASPAVAVIIPPAPLASVEEEVFEPSVAELAMLCVMGFDETLAKGVLLRLGGGGLNSHQQSPTVTCSI